MVNTPALRFLRSLAQAPNVDISQIKGNITDDQKQLLVNTFFYFVHPKEKIYGADIGQRLKILEMNVWAKGGSAPYGEVIFEIEVQKGKRRSSLHFELVTKISQDMCNVLGKMHGACASYMAEPYVPHLGPTK